MNVLAIDQGTSATKALLVGPGAEVLGRGEVPVRTRSVGADGVEADPEELFDSVLAAGRRALAAAAAPAHAVALANQGETVLAWDRSTGRPLSQAIVWQDRRSGGICARLADRAVRAVRHRGLHRRLDPRSRAGPAGRPGHGCRHPRTRGRHEAGDVGPGRVRGRATWCTRPRPRTSRRCRAGTPRGTSPPDSEGQDWAPGNPAPGGGARSRTPRSARGSRVACRCGSSRRCGGSRRTRSRPRPLPRGTGSCCAARSSAGRPGSRCGRTDGCWPGHAWFGWCRVGPCTLAPPGRPGSTRRAVRCAS